MHIFRSLRLRKWREQQRLRRELRKTVSYLKHLASMYEETKGNDDQSKILLWVIKAWYARKWELMRKIKPPLRSRYKT